MTNPMEHASMTRMRYFLLCVLLMCSCSGTGAIVRTAKGGYIAMGPASFLGDQKVDSYRLTTREGDSIVFTSSSTENPSKNATELVKTYLFWDGVKFTVRTLADIQKLRDAAAHSERLREFDLAAQQQGFAHEIELLQNAPPEATLP